MASPSHDTSLLENTSVWLGVSFVIFVFILWKMASESIAAALDKRADTIRQDMEKAENLRVEAQELLAQYQRKQRDAEKESARILDDAKKNAYQIRKTSEKELKELIALKETQLQERIDQMKAQAASDIQSYAANLAIAATREIISEQMNKKTQDALVSDSITNLKNIH